MAAAQPDRLAPGRLSKPLAWRLPAIETWTSVVAFVQTMPGRLVLFAAFAVLAKLVAGGAWQHGIWLQLTASAALVSLAGPWRRAAALLASAALLLRMPLDLPYAFLHRDLAAADLEATLLQTAALFVWFGLAACAIALVQRGRDHPLARHPVVTLHALTLLLLALLAFRVADAAQPLLAALTAALFAGFWFFVYALTESRARTPASPALRLSQLYPSLGLTHFPYGKGGEHWQRLEAASAADLAVTQLKGLKLMAWALCLKAVLIVFRHAVYTRLGVTPVFQAFDQFVYAGSTAFRFGLLGIIANFPEQVLLLAIKGHAIVAVARLAGFRLLRNTCRPFASRTVAEFWNRYFYYFKELLANVYFYPAYVRCFKRRPRLRLAFATFMAAGIGNFFFHFIMRDAAALEHFAPGPALAGFQTYAFYCAALVTGIVVSQLRAERRARRAPHGWLRAQLLPSLGVAAFYCFLSFFDGPQRHVALALHFQFLFHCLGVGR